MTQNKRIALNVMTTYGRSLYSLVCGLFTWRWVLMALGKTDYGLLGLVGGLIGFISFFNSILAVSVSRFYAYSVGAASVNSKDGLEECRRWFNLALTIHTVIPMIFVPIGYPIGVAVIRGFLSIPADRVDACVWIWRFVCFGGFVSMITIPFSAMYTAKQYIAELTIYSFVTTTLNIGVLYYMVSNPADWLVPYSFWSMLIAVVPSIIIAVRAVFIFPECKLTAAYLWDRQRARQLIEFGGGRFFGVVSKLLSGQGLAIVVNKCLGPVKNGTMTLGRGVMAQAMSLSGALSGAFSPAITNAAGAGDLSGMRCLALRACSFSTMAFLVFAIPLGLEIDKVLDLWLKSPPEGAASLCVCLLIVQVVDRLTEGHWMAIFAVGKVVRFQMVEAASCVVDFFFGTILILCGFDIVGVGSALILGQLVALVVKLFYGRKLAGIQVCRWVRSVLLPIVLVITITTIVGAIPKMMMNASFVRIVITTLCCEMICLPLAWAVLLSREDRAFIKTRISHFIAKADKGY